jgi:hypothetical protein
MMKIWQALVFRHTTAKIRLIAVAPSYHQRLEHRIGAFASRRARASSRAGRAFSRIQRRNGTPLGALRFEIRCPSPLLAKGCRPMVRPGQPVLDLLISSSAQFSSFPGAGNGHTSALHSVTSGRCRMALAASSASHG